MIVKTKKPRKSNSYYYCVVLVVVSFLSIVTDWYEPLLLILSGTVFLFILDKLGKGIVLRELIAFHSCIICLVMPWIGYQWYTNANQMAKLWVRYMPVKEDVYFNYALPAVAMFSLAICWPIKKKDMDDEGDYMYNYIVRLKVVLSNKPQSGIQVLILGFAAALITPFLPDSFKFVGNLLTWSSFAGVLYIYFTSNLKLRGFILIAFVLLIIQQALAQGMFTIVAYMGITIFSFLFLQRKSPIWKKMGIFILAVFLLFIIQSVKSSFRRLAWKEDYQGNKVTLFSDLVTDKLDAFSGAPIQDIMFPIYYRANQGFNVGLVMRKFPARKEFDNGSRLAVVIASSLVPRFLWPDKPEAGGKFNMEYYTGAIINGYSTNVGPLGEAYGSFGVTGGIVYMFLLGLFVRWFYAEVFKVSRKIPLLILWIPLLFYQVTYSGENDSLQILNSLSKSAFLLFILYKAFPSLFGQGRHLTKKGSTRSSLSV